MKKIINFFKAMFKSFMEGRAKQKALKGGKKKK